MLLAALTDDALEAIVICPSNPYLRLPPERRPLNRRVQARMAAFYYRYCPVAFLQATDGSQETPLMWEPPSTNSVLPVI